MKRRHTVIEHFSAYLEHVPSDDLPNVIRAHVIRQYATDERHLVTDLTAVAVRAIERQLLGVLHNVVAQLGNARQNLVAYWTFSNGF